LWLRGGDLGITILKEVVRFLQCEIRLRVYGESKSTSSTKSEETKAPHGIAYKSELADVEKNKHAWQSMVSNDYQRYNGFVHIEGNQSLFGLGNRSESTSDICVYLFDFPVDMMTTMDEKRTIRDHIATFVYLGRMLYADMRQYSCSISELMPGPHIATLKSAFGSGSSSPRASDQPVT